MGATKVGPAAEPHKTKKFGKGERSIPHHTQKAKKYYSAEDEPSNRKTRKTVRPFKPRSSLQPGTVLILLAGRFRGKRVILLKTLPQGVLLVTGPFKINGVPLRRVNHKFVIATKTRVPLKGVDEKVLEKVGGEGYFTKDKPKKKVGEDSFFQQGEKHEKKKVASERATDQKSVDKVILSNIAKQDLLKSYLSSTFSIRSGDRPHEQVY